jgi:hypothetical protein
MLQEAENQRKMVCTPKMPTFAKIEFYAAQQQAGQGSPEKQRSPT